MGKCARFVQRPAGQVGIARRGPGEGPYPDYGVHRPLNAVQICPISAHLPRCRAFQRSRRSASAAGATPYVDRPMTSPARHSRRDGFRHTLS
jgi:hypothetical protein